MEVGDVYASLDQTGRVVEAVVDIRDGPEADRPVNPRRGNAYFAHDTRILYLCPNDAGAWVGVELTS